jgi:hypothetical protein
MIIFISIGWKIKYFYLFYFFVKSALVLTAGFSNLGDVILEAKSLLQWQYVV